MLWFEQSAHFPFSWKSRKNLLRRCAAWRQQQAIRIEDRTAGAAPSPEPQEAQVRNPPFCCAPTVGRQGIAII